MNKKYDLIIIGAGPAGLMLANQLNNSGLNILILDKRQDLKKLDANIFVTFRDTIEKFNLNKCVLNDFPNVCLYAAKNFVKVNFKEKPLAVIDLNNWVKKLDLNCEIKLCSEVIDFTGLKKGIKLLDQNNNEFFGNLIVDCSGGNQIMTKLSKLNKSSVYFECYGLILENCNIPDITEFSLCSDFKYTNGGGWLYPFSKTKCQVGLGDLLPYKNNYENDLEERTLKLIKEFEPYKTWLKDAKIVSKISKKAPIVTPHHHMVQDNIILLGDSGGFSTPLLGEGIRISFEMAQILSQIIIDAFNQKDFSKSFLKKFEKSWLEKYGNNYVWSLILRHFWAFEFTNKEVFHLVNKINELPNDEAYNFLRSNLYFKQLAKLIDFKIVDEVVLNFFKSHLTHFNKFEEINEKIELPEDLLFKDKK